MIAFNKYLNMKKDSSNHTYSEKVDWKQYRPSQVFEEVKPFTILGDDRMHS